MICSSQTAFKGWDPSDPAVGTNRYAYSLNDPINRSDPSGHVSCGNKKARANCLKQAMAAQEKADELLQQAIKAFEAEDLPRAYALFAASGLAGGIGEYMAQTNGKAFDIVALGMAVIPY